MPRLGKDRRPGTRRLPLPAFMACETLFMAAWLLENRAEAAEKVLQGDFSFPQNRGCPFWDEHSDYHCTIYGGRPEAGTFSFLVCRSFQ